MLPLPPIRFTPKRPRRSWIKRLDAYTLWAFNPQPPFARRSGVRPDGDAAP